MATAISIIGTIITAIGFLQSNMPARAPSSKQVTFRFHAGLDGAKPANGNPLSNAGGHIPDIRVWNERGKFLGAKYDPGKLKSGAWGDVTVSLSENNQPTYVLFTGNDDALCMAYVTAKWTDGGQYGWVGNWADKDSCKRSWYYSDIWIKDRKVRCAWIDRNGDVPTTGIQVHFPEFTNSKKNKDRGKSYFCAQKPPLKFHTSWEPNTVTYWTNSNRKRDTSAFDEVDGGAYGPEPEDEESWEIAETEAVPKPNAESAPVNPPVFQAYNDTRLVRSSEPSHSATILCEDELSRGPDLLSLYEGRFCDMTTREILPLCKEGQSVDCFDDKDRQVKRSLGARDEHDIKDYTDVLEWGN